MVNIRLENALLTFRARTLDRTVSLSSSRGDPSPRGSTSKFVVVAFHRHAATGGAGLLIVAINGRPVKNPT